MKKLILLWTALFLLPLFLLAQSGKVIYEQRINLHKRLGEENAQMKAMLPEWQQWKTQLLFKDNQSIYQNYEDETSDGDISASSGGMRIQLQRPESITYMNLDQKEQIQQEEFMQKRYLITEPTPKRSWKITGETREVLGFLCQQAVLQDDEDKREIVAWFAPEIAIATGPAVYGQLPGLILVVDIDNGTSTIEAKVVDLSARIGDKAIQPPNKGTPISREDFRKTQEEAMEQMNHGGNRGVRIRF